MSQVMIVDDNVQDAKAMEHALQQAGHQVVCVCTDPAKAFGELKKYQPHVIVLDTVIPGSDGFEICRQIKAQDSPPTKVVMITGDVDAVDASKARDHGADDYLVKTSDYRTLVKAINTLA